MTTHANGSMVPWPNWRLEVGESIRWIPGVAVGKLTTTNWLVKFLKKKKHRILKNQANFPWFFNKGCGWEDLGHGDSETNDSQQNAQKMWKKIDPFGLRQRARHYSVSSLVTWPWKFHMKRKIVQPTKRWTFFLSQGFLSCTETFWMFIPSGDVHPIWLQYFFTTWWWQNTQPPWNWWKSPCFLLKDSGFAFQNDALSDFR